MGCSHPGHRRPLEQIPGGTGEVKPEVPLLSEYTLGKRIGDGAFGMVSTCFRKDSAEEFAVKMIEAVDDFSADVTKEARILKVLDHPNIVKLHGVFLFKTFVCIVMDKYRGGDLVEGLQRQMKTRGLVDSRAIVHVAHQMASSIQYLHARSVVHRDVKGDNFLMDRDDMVDRGCRIALTDFGAACAVAPGERLSSQLGTRRFSPPEFFDRNYGPAVDIWALGVVMYGLVSGRFPFKDEKDVRSKVVKISKKVDPECADFIHTMLEKREDFRATADDVLTHPYLMLNPLPAGEEAVSMDEVVMAAAAMTAVLQTAKPSNPECDASRDAAVAPQKGPPAAVAPVEQQQSDRAAKGGAVANHAVEAVQGKRGRKELRATAAHADGNLMCCLSGLRRLGSSLPLCRLADWFYVTLKTGNFPGDLGLMPVIASEEVKAPLRWPCNLHSCA